MPGAFSDVQSIQVLWLSLTGLLNFCCREGRSQTGVLRKSVLLIGVCRAHYGLTCCLACVIARLKGCVQLLLLEQGWYRLLNICSMVSDAVCA